MSIVSDDEILTFLDVETVGYFQITAANDVMRFTASAGGTASIDIPDSTYNGAGLATALNTAMDADATLTGGAVTFTVAYSTSTRKFTITPSTGTIAYDHSESDGGLTLGFNADHSAASSITSNVAAGDPIGVVTDIRDAVEDWIQNSYCYRTFATTSYTLEEYDGNGEQIIHLKNFPLTAVDLVCVGTLDVIRIKNTSDYTQASVSVTSTGLRLVKDGTADETVLWASNTTMAAVVTAVNTLGNGWEAAMQSTAYNSFASSFLLERWAASAIDDNWIYLQMPDDPEDDIKVDPDRGQIRKYSKFPEGFRNIYVTYTAGYSSTTMPEDLKLAVKILTKYIIQRREEETFGVDSFWAGNIKTMFEKEAIPLEAKQILDRYRRVII